MMNQRSEMLLGELRDEMEKMTSDERIGVMVDLMEGYCIYCGRKVNPGEMPCQCWNDD